MTASPRWKWPFKLLATVPVVWLLVLGLRSGDGGVLRDVAALGVPLAVLAGACFFALVALFCRDLQRVLELLPAEARVASPRSVWWMMVLPLNFVEDFFIVANVASSLERGGLRRFAARGWGFGWCAAQLVSLLPGVTGELGSVVAVPLWGLHWWSVRSALGELRSRSPTP